MAFFTGQFQVRAKRIERRLGVVKLLVDAFFAIVAGAAIGRILTGMGRHESLVDFGMAGGAVVGGKGFVTTHVAGLADKWRTLRGFLV